MSEMSERSGASLKSERPVSGKGDQAADPAR